MWSVVDVEDNVATNVWVYKFRGDAITGAVNAALHNGFCPNVMGPNELRQKLEEDGRYVDGGVTVCVVYSGSDYKGVLAKDVKDEQVES